MNSKNSILKQEKRLYQAQLKSDVESLDELIDDRLIFTALDGSLATKQDDLAAHHSPHFTITKMQPLEQHVIDLNNIVVVNALMDTEAIIQGVIHIAKIRYTRIWQRQEGGWKIVAGHMSALQTNPSEKANGIESTEA